MKPLLLTGAVLALLFGACGGDDSDPAGGDESRNTPSANGNGNAEPTRAPDGSQAPACPLKAEHVSGVMEAPFVESSAGGLCSFEERDAEDIAREVIVRQSNPSVFDEPGLQELDIGDQSALDLIQSSVFLRIGSMTVEIQVPGGVGPDLEEELVLIELAGIAATELQ